MTKFLKEPKHFIYLGTIVIFLLGFILHFLYDWTNENVIIGVFTPIDESIWEHTKLVFFPLIAWYSIYFLFMFKKIDIDRDKWFTTMLINIIISVLIIPLFYYFVNAGLAIENKIVNIIILLLSLTIGSLISVHFYHYGRGINYVISVCIVCFLVFIYILFTYSKVNLPLFYE